MLKPKEIIKELDRYIISQDDAKRAVSIALRNRWRRQQLESPLKEDIIPKNIILIGPTGVGKTEIARRLAHLADAPFIKVEASKFTEVGYVGKDVESIIRDLTRTAVNMIKQEEEKKIRDKAIQKAEKQVLEAYIKTKFKPEPFGTEGVLDKDDLLEKLKSGLLDNEKIDIKIEESIGPKMEVLSFPGMEEMTENIKDMFNNIMPTSPKNKIKKSMTVKKAKKLIEDQELNKMIDMEKIKTEALDRVQNNGIVFIDEIDKIASSGSNSGADVSREGVQRDILPLVEGSTVNTKYGIVKTDHILFIAAGAFHVSKPSDLMPELQGRFPIRVELKSLNANDFKRILVEPDTSLIKQYKALIETEGVKLNFTDDAVEQISKIAEEINSKMENIGARRLHTIMERLLDDVSFNASEISGQKITVNAKYVEKQLRDLVKDKDLSKFIL